MKLLETPCFIQHGEIADVKKGAIFERLKLGKAVALPSNICFLLLATQLGINGKGINFGTSIVVFGNVHTDKRLLEIINGSDLYRAFRPDCASHLWSFYLGTPNFFSPNLAL